MWIFLAYYVIIPLLCPKLERSDHVKSMDKVSTKSSDEKIIEMYWQKDENAIKETDIKYGQFLFHIAYGILHDRLDCEECRNDTYLGIWKAIPPTRPSVFPAFITQIIRRIAINRYKEKTSKKRIPSRLTVSLEDYENISANNDNTNSQHTAEEIGLIINNYVNELPERGRYIFIGRFYMAESVENIADDLNISVATAYRELDKIKKGLKLHLEKKEIYI